MIFHIDMDAFFASVEQLDNPRLKGRCVIVGGHSDRGVVCAASYEAREFGVHSAMPLFRARQLCPDAVFLSPRKNRYQEVSSRIFNILREFTPLVEPVSVDEAFLDITGTEKLFGDPVTLARRIKSDIRERIGLICSVGGAPEKFLAKIASDMDKPDGLKIIWPDEMESFIETLPVRKVPGVGKVALKKLGILGVETLGDVKQYPDDYLKKHLGRFGYRLKELAFSRDRNRVSTSSETKSISSENTLENDTSSLSILKRHLKKQSLIVGRELRKEALRGKTVTIKIKHHDFKQYTRSRTVFEPLQSTNLIYKTAAELLDDYAVKKPVRLIGVGVSNLISVRAPVQASLFPEKEKDRNRNWEKLDRVVDAITSKYGKRIFQTPEEL